MTAKISIKPWIPDAKSLPPAAEPDKVYVLPTRYGADGSEPNKIMYTDEVRYVPKEARSQGLPVEFSMPKDDRHYLSEYSIDPITLAIALACVGPINDWVIWTVDNFRQSRRKLAGHSQDEIGALPLRVSIAELSSDSILVKGLEMEGAGDDVIEALKELKISGG